ncbi:hypothetical protein [Actibacterium sp. 188UL27-1]|uniref:hypothetical protein n=1 Tax=Actibacterium sp. 188UL27-1 TaxID=2786961 RepID=UPI001957926F|nr:hypothetical protein [Actibacterium sp. 188UL27-1]MBM7069946.1 hypothetical protein [Actibacterium sp. 188UL27-1]
MSKYQPRKRVEVYDLVKRPTAWTNFTNGLAVAGWVLIIFTVIGVIAAANGS